MPEYDDLLRAPEFENNGHWKRNGKYLKNVAKYICETLGEMESNERNCKLPGIITYKNLESEMRKNYKKEKIQLKAESQCLYHVVDILRKIGLVDKEYAKKFIVKKCMKPANSKSAQPKVVYYQKTNARKACTQKDL